MDQITLLSKITRKKFHFFWLTTNISVKVIQQGQKVRARTNSRTNGLRVTDPRRPYYRTKKPGRKMKLKSEEESNYEKRRAEQ